jgi:hypothetical protein
MRQPKGARVNGSLIKFFHKRPAYVRCSKPQTKPLKETDENAKQQDRIDHYKVTKPAEEEWNQTDTQLLKYGRNISAQDRR